MRVYCFNYRVLGSPGKMHLSPGKLFLKKGRDPENVASTDFYI